MNGAFDKRNLNRPATGPERARRGFCFRGRSPAGPFVSAASPGGKAGRHGMGLDTQSQKEYLESRSAAPVGIYRAIRLLVLPLSLLVIGAGYLLIWSVSPDAPLETVLTKTRLGIMLTILGGALFAFWLYRSSK